MECASAKRALTPMPDRGIDVPMAKYAIGCAQRESQRRTMTRRAMAPSNARRAWTARGQAKKAWASLGPPPDRTHLPGRTNSLIIVICGIKTTRLPGGEASVFKMKTATAAGVAPECCTPPRGTTLQLQLSSCDLDRLILASAYRRTVGHFPWQSRRTPWRAQVQREH